MNLVGQASQVHRAYTARNFVESTFCTVKLTFFWCTVHPYCSLLHNPVIDVLPVRDRLQCEHFYPFVWNMLSFASANCHSTYLLKYHALSPFGEFIIYFYELISGRFLPKASLCVSSANRNVKNSEAFGMSLGIGIVYGPRMVPYKTEIYIYSTQVSIVYQYTVQLYSICPKCFLWVALSKIQKHFYV